MANKNLRLEGLMDDELLDEVIEAEKRGAEWKDGYRKPEHLNAVQLTIEREFLGYDGKLSYGVIIDALDYIIRKPIFKHVNFEWEKFVEEDEIGRVSKRIIEPLLEAVSREQIRNEEVPKILTAIKVRYRNYCEYGDRGRYGARGKKIWPKARVPYDVMWEPWFKGLSKKFKRK